MLQTLVLAIVLAVVSVLGGLTISYYADLPPGGTTVLVAAAAALVASAPAHLLDRRAR